MERLHSASRKLSLHKVPTLNFISSSFTLPSLKVERLHSASRKLSLHKVPTLNFISSSFTLPSLKVERLHSASRKLSLHKVPTLNFISSSFTLPSLKVERLHSASRKLSLHKVPTLNFTEATTVTTVFLQKKYLVTSQRTEPTPTITFPLLGVCFHFIASLAFWHVHDALFRRPHMLPVHDPSVWLRDAEH